jgi:hypothetical protein
VTGWRTPLGNRPRDFAFGVFLTDELDGRAAVFAQRDAERHETDALFHASSSQRRLMRPGTRRRFEPIRDEGARVEMPQTMPRAYVDAFFRFFVDGTLDESPVLPTVQAVLGRPPHSFADWATANAGFGPALRRGCARGRRVAAPRESVDTRVPHAYLR